MAQAVLLSACSDSPRQTTLAALAENQQQFDGRKVSVRGTLRTFDAPRHYWIENDALDRVALEGATELDTKVGQTITVLGVFHYDQVKGRRIQVDTLIAEP